MPTTVSITPGQQSKLTQLAEDAVRRAVRTVLEKNLTDSDGAQKIIVRGDEFGAPIEDAMTPLIERLIRELSSSNKYANEEVASKYVYPPTHRVRSITEQTNRLRELIRGAGFSNEQLAEMPLLPGAEGHFAILRWQTIASTYGEACQKLMDIAEKVYGKKRFKNWLEGRLDVAYLRQGQRSIAKFAALAKQQEGYDILVVQAQLGLRHAGRSPRRADECFLGNEFGLGLFGNLCVILTHPERLSTGEELWIDCAGDEFSPDAAGQFEVVPCLDFSAGQFQLGNDGFGYACGYCGSASGFLPQ